MNKLALLKEIGKLAAYGFVTVGLVGTTLAQFRVVADIVQPAVESATSK